MLFFGQPGFNNPLSRSIIVENEASMIVPVIDIDPDMVLVEEKAAGTQWILEIASDVHEEFTEIVTNIIADDHESDGMIRSDVAKNFKKRRYWPLTFINTILIIAEHFTLLGDDICFKRRDHLIRAFFGFITAFIKQIMQTEHAVAHIGVNKMMALIVQKYYGIPKAYIREYVKDCEACSRFNSLKTIQPIYINHFTKKYDLFMMDCVDLRRYSDQNDQYSWILNLINKTSELVRDSLKFLFDNFGVPMAIQSDNGREFKNTLLKALLTDLNIKFIHGRPRKLKAQKFTEIVTNIIADDLEIDNNISSEICLMRSSFDKKKDFDMNTKTKRAPFDSFYDNSVFTVTAILMSNMIEVKNNDGDTRTVFRGAFRGLRGKNDIEYEEEEFNEKISSTFKINSYLENTDQNIEILFDEDQVAVENKISTCMKNEANVHLFRSKLYLRDNNQMTKKGKIIGFCEEKLRKVLTRSRSESHIFNDKIQILAYADDVDFIARSEASLQGAYIALESAAKKIPVLMFESEFWVVKKTDEQRLAVEETNSWEFYSKLRDMPVQHRIPSKVLNYIPVEKRNDWWNVILERDAADLSKIK
ncbi:hypothetical protein CWI38_0004p0050 [Hamiltosporidium tvaerminnensis]|uniref:Integrase catalytic domain-containing protein n=1 Tax=Hamiltosporidium tvaerminnensis TaxID=1176355 RepID=A0A4Q9M2H7_9MICR|nr:hypothetical protein CWI38_0006p0080 [Hamiltosporidium tvaerminnensis]TBU20998.1 hypothetical protein CWI38_0004p0050 [Hamiltosporidium tvaerminnensis]